MLIDIICKNCKEKLGFFTNDIGIIQINKNISYKKVRIKSNLFDDGIFEKWILCCDKCNNDYELLVKM